MGGGLESLWKTYFMVKSNQRYFELSNKLHQVRKYFLKQSTSSDVLYTLVLLFMWKNQWRLTLKPKVASCLTLRYDPFMMLSDLMQVTGLYHQYSLSWLECLWKFKRIYGQKYSNVFNIIPETLSIRTHFKLKTVNIIIFLYTFCCYLCEKINDVSH